MPGFTLMELLIVITIIVVMAGLILVIMRNVRGKANEAKALASIRQIAIANVSYAAENNGDINVLLDSNDPRTTGGYITKNYWGRLSPFLFPDLTVSNNAASAREIRMRLNSLFSTSDAKLMTGAFQQGSRVYADGSGLPVPFAFSKYIYKWNQYLKTSSFDDPSQTIYMTYGFYRMDEEDGAKYEPIPKIGEKRNNNIDWFASRSAAFVFLDGHAEVLSAPVPKRRFSATP